MTALANSGISETRQMLKEMNDSYDELHKVAERLSVLATKWVRADHYDWSEIKDLIIKLDELK